MGLTQIHTLDQGGLQEGPGAVRGDRSPRQGGGNHQVLGEAWKATSPWFG